MRPFIGRSYHFFHIYNTRQFFDASQIIFDCFLELHIVFPCNDDHIYRVLYLEDKTVSSYMGAHIAR